MFNKVMSRIVGGATPEPILESVFKPIRRLDGEGMWQQMGAVTHPKDIRTQKELVKTIKAYAEEIPEVRDFLPHLDEMNSKHLGFVADTIELASKRDMLMTDVDMKVPVKDGKSVLALILEKLPKASKENPSLFKFATDIIDNTDSITSKFFLTKMVGADAQTILDRGAYIQRLVSKNISSRHYDNPQDYNKHVSELRKTLEREKEIPISNNRLMDMPGLGQQMEAVSPMVKPLAESTLNGMYLGTYERQTDFLKALGTLVNPKAKPEKIAMLPKVSRVIDEISPKKYEIFIDDFAQSDTPINQVRENLSTLTEVARMVEAQNSQTINAVDYLNKNTNLY